MTGRSEPAIRVTVRRAEPGDLTCVHEIERASFADPWTLDAFRETFDQNRAWFEVAIGEQSEVLGYAIAWMTADEAELANLAVAPGARGHHIGARLLDRMLEASKALGMRSAFLEVRASNAAALSLYVSRGFQSFGRRAKYYRRPVEDALIMRRDLIDPTNAMIE